MHEMSIAESILQIAVDEMQKHNMRTLRLIRVRYGVLSQVVPEALQFCFEALVRDGVYEGVVLELEEVPALMRCFGCGKTFSPQDRHEILLPCPHCGEVLGHEVLQGRELSVQHIEAE